MDKDKDTDKDKDKDKDKNKDKDKDKDKDTGKDMENENEKESMCKNWVVIETTPDMQAAFFEASRTHPNDTSSECDTTGAHRFGYAPGSPLLLDDGVDAKPTLPYSSVTVPLVLSPSSTPPRSSLPFGLSAAETDLLRSDSAANPAMTASLRYRLSELMELLGGSVSSLWGAGGGAEAEASASSESTPTSSAESATLAELSRLREQLREDQTRQQADIDLLRASLVPLIQEAQRTGAMTSSSQLYPLLPDPSRYDPSGIDGAPGPTGGSSDRSSISVPAPPAPPPPPPAPPAPGAGGTPQLSWREKQQLAARDTARVIPPRRQLEEQLRSLIAESEVTPANRAKVCSLWLEKAFRDLPEVNAHLSCMLDHYPFLVRELALKPVHAFKRMRLWESLLFEQLSSEEAARCRRRKIIEITRLESEDEIATEVKAIQKVLHAEKVKREEAKLRADSRRTMSSVVEELEEVIRERGDHQAERHLEESLLLDEAIDEELDILSLL